MNRRPLYLIAILGIAIPDHLESHQKKSSRPPVCCAGDEKKCKNLQDPCKCYCAYKPGPRDKVADDCPIYIENDPDGIYCYCKQRDIDKHEQDKLNTHKE